jgi:hypothetical protein
MRRMSLWLCLIFTVAVLPCRAYEAGTPHEYCGTNIPPDQTTGFVPLPEGDVFCPLLADPKATHSYVAYVRGTSTSPLGSDLASFGIGDRFGIARWNGARPGDGFQINLEGAVFAQLDLNTESYDLVNADYMLGLPMTYRYGGFSGRLRLYHQSSHLGDELLLHSRIQRENFSFEASEAILSYDAGPLRLYGGGEYILHSIPSDLDHWVLHGGLELRQPEGALHEGRTTRVRLIAAGDAKSVQDLDWETAYSAVAGFEFSGTREGTHAMRRWSVLGHYYYGPAPYGQFFRSDVTYYGVGVHFAL